MLTIISIILATILTDSTPSYEQLAADYFFETIWKEKYKDHKSIEFENKTDTTIYAGNVFGCTNWNETDKKEIKRRKTNQQVLLNSKPAGISFKRQRSMTRFKLTIGTRIQLGDNYIVQLTVYKTLDFIDYYFIKFNKDGEIIDRCEFSEII